METLPAEARPVARSARLNAAPLVLLAGLGTTALALFGVWYANQNGENVMGWYANYIIPAGAVIVGLGASSGYGLGSYFTGTKITGRLLVTVLVMLLASYFVAQWLEFQLLFPGGAVGPDGESAGFWTYYDLTTRSFYFKPKHDGDAVSPLGLWGYGLRTLEVIGFVGGGAVVPLVLRSLPYCAHCEVYKKTRAVRLFSAGVPVKSISKKKTEELAAYEKECEEAWARGEAQMKAIFAAAGSNDAAALARELDKAEKVGGFAAQKLTARIALSLIHCPRCHDGALKATMQTGSGNQMKTTDLAVQPMDRGAVADFLRLKR